MYYIIVYGVRYGCLTEGLNVWPSVSAARASFLSFSQDAASDPLLNYSILQYPCVNLKLQNTANKHT